MDPTMRQQVRAVLQRGLERVRIHWGKGANGPVPPGTVCASMAIWIAPSTGTPDPDHASPAVMQADHILRNLIQPADPTARRVHLTSWNDRQTSNAPVVALYERAIAALDAEEASG
jgi:hypothetical protein